MQSVLERHEHLSVVNLKGSILAWTHLGMPLAAGGREAGREGGPAAGSSTTRVHVFGEKWALQHPAYEAVTFGKATYASQLLGALWSYSIAPALDGFRALLRRFWPWP